MIKKLLLLVVLLAASCLSATSLPQKSEHFVQASKEDGNLKWQLDQLLESEGDLRGALAGVSVRSAKSGEIVYEHLGDIRLRPASNMKIFTAAAALSVLGPDYRFSTELHANGSAIGNVLHGDLFLKGRGNPTLLPEDLNEMAKMLKEKGIKEITGNLIADDSWYDNVRHPLDMPWSDESTYYGAQISSLTVSPDPDYDVGTVVIEVSSGQSIGKPGKIVIKPHTDYVKIVNKVVTVSPDGKKEVKFRREHGSNTIFVEGMMPAKGTPLKEWVSVWEPSGYALDLFKQSLSKHGITVNGDYKRGITPSVTNIFHVQKSPPLKEILVPFMKLSNNAHAEMLVKEMGKVVKGEGSWEKGLFVLEAEMKKLGVNTKQLVMRDGSGISHVDLVPAHEFTRLLFQVQKKVWFPAFLNSLPVGGLKGKMDGGTLRKRMKEAPLKEKVKAKTGSISTVSTISGYIDTTSGDKLVFSILLNNLVDDEKGKKIEDQILRILATEK